MEGGISWNLIIVIGIFVGTVWFIVRDDKKPRKTSNTTVQEINLNVNVKIDKQSAELIKELSEGFKAYKEYTGGDTL